MAKKKTKDTKGLAGVIEYGKSAASGKDIRLNKKVKPANQGGGPNYLGEVETVTVPKQWLSSPDHVVAELAYITPAEQKILLEANLYGSLDGVPNRGPGGLMSLQGDMSGGSYSGGGSEGESEARDAASSSSSSKNDSGIDADTGIDAETSDDYTPGVDVSDTYKAGVGTGFGSWKGYNDIKGGGQSSDRGPVSYGPKSAAPRDQRLFGGERGQAGYTQAQMQELEARDSFLSRAIQDRLKEGVYDIITDNKGNIVGVTSPAKGLPGSLARGLGSIIDKVMGTGGQRLGDKAYQPSDLFDAVYTGRNEYNPFDTGGGRDDGDGGQEKKVVVTVTDAAVSAVPTSDPSYYGQGVGTATTNLYDPTKIDPYLASLYGITPSPIGATYDAATSSYSMPGSKKNAKSRTRLRGLDIFKPVSTVS